MLDLFSGLDDRSESLSPSFFVLIAFYFCFPQTGQPIWVHTLYQKIRNTFKLKYSYILYTYINVFMCWFTRTALFKKKNTGSCSVLKRLDLIRKASLFSENRKIWKIFNLQESWRLGLFTRPESDRKRSNGFKLKEGKCRVDIGQKSFSVSVMREGKRFTWEAVDSPATAIFKAKLDGSLTKLI